MFAAQYELRDEHLAGVNQFPHSAVGRCPVSEKKDIIAWKGVHWRGSRLPGSVVKNFKLTIRFSVR